jgi:predicted ATPase
MITELSIENFKSVKKAEIKFGSLTIFTGINGMGKSSCIQTLLLLRQSFLLGRLNDSGGLLLDGDYCKPGNGKDIFFYEADPSELINFTVTISDSEVFQFSFGYDKDSDLQPSRQIPDLLRLSQINLFNDNFFYLNADRLSPERDIFPSSQSNILRGNLGKNGQFAAHYIASNQRKPLTIAALKHPKASTDSLIDSVEGWLSEIAPGIKLKAQFYPEINSTRLGYSYETDSGSTDEFKPINVGYGLTYVLPILTQILIAKPGQLVIIENPESHLHPGGQAAIARLLCIAAMNDVQVLIETHSDHIINGVIINIKKYFATQSEGIDRRRVRIHFVDRALGQAMSEISLIEIEDDGRVRNAPKNFFDQFAKDMKSIMGF